MDRIANLLVYIGVPDDDLARVWDKINYWDFVNSLAVGLEKYGSLTVKQKASLENLILKHTGTVCKPNLIVHTKQYKRKGKANKPGNRVAHDFGKLNTIQLFDLPFTSMSENTAEFHPYNVHSLVVFIAGVGYKIPKPVLWEPFVVPTTITFVYRRTEMKGYMEKKR